MYYCRADGIYVKLYVKMATRDSWHNESYGFTQFIIIFTNVIWIKILFKVSWERRRDFFMGTARSAITFYKGEYKDTKRYHLILDCAL